MKFHKLKLQEQFFPAVQAGLKTAELRVNDRNYTVGDYLEMHEIDLLGNFSGNMVLAEVTHIANVDFILLGYVLLSIKLVKN